MTKNVKASISGDCATGFTAVLEAFRYNFEHDIEVGASFCAYQHGQPIVDLWGGHKDRERSTAWEQDTLVNLYSTTKGLSCLALAALLDDGVLDLQEPVADKWPELHAARSGLTLGQLLSHQGGLCGLEQTIEVSDLYDWSKMIRLLEQQQPLWDPGTAVGYHSVTWGYLLGEMVRRACGQTLAEVFSTRIVEPLEAQVHLAVRPDASVDISPLVGPNHARTITGQPLADADSDDATAAATPLSAMVMTNPVIRPYQDASSSTWQQAEIAAANGQGNARGIARLYAAAAQGGKLDGHQIVSAQALEAICTPLVSSEQQDLVLGYGLNRGAGVILNTGGQYGPNNTAFGHSGAGGSIGFADPTSGVAVAYAMNQMQPGSVETTRAARLIDALYRCLN